MGLMDSLKNLFSGGGSAKGAKGAKKLPRIDLNKRFELIARLGQGSMSKVWRARDRTINRVVCIKLLDKVKTAKFEARFTGSNKPQEGAVCVSLKHPNIVTTYEHGLTFQGEPYLIMELIEGLGFNFLVETKASQLTGNRVNFLLQLTDAIDYVHQHGSLHRDICPRNVMVTKANVVKIIDFGLAVPNTPDFRKPGNRTGTPNYLAPELIKRVATDHRVDMFALGVTAYEVFTGHLPWERAESLQTLLSHLNSPGRDPRERRPDLDDATAKFLIKAIERDPNRRFQSATDFREALARLPAGQ